MEGSVRGLPLLSGPPPQREEPNRHGCRKCGKEFGLFTRSRNCNHCGFTYCTSCSDHQALMARGADDGPGYDVVQVCGFCIEKLTITASGRGQLRAMPIATLRGYLKAYGLRAPQNALEKDDIVDACISARTPNGCLPLEAEDYYRKHSVPNKTPRTRSLFSRIINADVSTPSASPSSSSSRPASTTPTPPRTNTQTRPARPAAPRAVPRPPQTPSQYSVPNSSPYSYRPPQAQPTPPTNTRPRAPPATAPRPAAPAPPPRPPTPPVPSMEELLNYTPQQLHALSITALKSILFQNHVIVGQILEKDDLVTKVQHLVNVEREDREREAAIHAAEEEAYLRQQAAMLEEHRARERERERAERDQDNTSVEHGSTEGDREEHVHTPEPAATEAPMAASPPKATYVPPTIERTGLCVICQDEEANIVIVDCGHLAMCRGCSELVMNTSRECPLCRTRIVTPQRLLRVFKS